MFSLHSPVIEKIEVKKIAKVRRAKLNFLRGRRGKSARLNERFTTDEEFGIAVQQGTRCCRERGGNCSGKGREAGGSEGMRSRFGINTPERRVRVRTVLARP